MLQQTVSDCQFEVLMLNMDNLSALGEQSSGPNNASFDAAGTENNATIYGANATPGRFYGGFTFDGVDDYLNVTYDKSIDIRANNPRTI